MPDSLFESSVNLYSSKTFFPFIFGFILFESSVNLYSSKTNAKTGYLGECLRVV